MAFRFSTDMNDSSNQVTVQGRILITFDHKQLKYSTTIAWTANLLEKHLSRCRIQYRKNAFGGMNPAYLYPSATGANESTSGFGFQIILHDSEYLDGTRFKTPHIRVGETVSWEEEAPWPRLMGSGWNFAPKSMWTSPGNISLHSASSSGRPTHTRIWI